MKGWSTDRKRDRTKDRWGEKMATNGEWITFQNDAEWREWGEKGRNLSIPATADEVDETPDDATTTERKRKRRMMREWNAMRRWWQNHWSRVGAMQIEAKRKFCKTQGIRYIWYEWENGAIIRKRSEESEWQVTKLRKKYTISGKKTSFGTFTCISPLRIT